MNDNDILKLEGIVIRFISKGNKLSGNYLVSFDDSESANLQFLMWGKATNLIDALKDYYTKSLDNWHTMKYKKDRLDYLKTKLF